jgi:hypothetical protein
MRFPGVSGFLVFCLTFVVPASASVWAGSARRVWIRYATPGKAKMETFTHIERVGCFRNELRSEPAKKREHLFSCGIDEGHIRYIDQQCHSVKAARYESARVLGVVAGESAFKLESHSVRRIVHLDP